MEEASGLRLWEGLTPLMFVVAEFPRMYAVIIFFQRSMFGKVGDGRKLSLVLVWVRVFACMTPRGRLQAGGAGCMCRIRALDDSATRGGLRESPLSRQAIGTD